MIDVDPKHLATVRRILREHVLDREVRAFGSRVTGRPKPYSDLDLAVVGPGQTDPDVLRRLKEAFEESDLPFRVDVVDWSGLSEGFRSVIERDFEVVQRGASARREKAQPSRVSDPSAFRPRGSPN